MKSARSTDAMEFFDDAGAGTVVGVYAALTYDIISATNSSPQTTEINANKRAGTLMKWVNIGLVQAAGFIILGTVLMPPKLRWAPAIGGGTAGVLLYAQYVYAKQSGLENPGPATESTSESPGSRKLPWSWLNPAA